MHFKGPIWEYFQKNTHFLRDASPGVYALKAQESLSVKLVMDTFDKEKLYEKKFHVVLGNELTAQWIDDHWQSLSLFGNEQSYLVLSAQDIAPEVEDKILERDLISDNCFYCFHFENESEFFKRLDKLKKATCIEITPPNFWEYRQLLEFLSSHLQVYLNYEASSMALESLEEDIVQYYNLLNQLKLNYADQNIGAEEISHFISKQKLDQFLLANLFAQKKFTLFYRNLLELTSSDQDYRSFFSFMQRHMAKIADPRFLDGKKKLSKYDRQILDAHKIWPEDAIWRSVNYFKQLETDAKLSSSLLGAKIKRNYLRSLA